MIIFNLAILFQLYIHLLLKKKELQITAK